VAVRLSKLLESLLQVDDVDAVPLAEDVLLHLRIPSFGLVAEVHTSLQQFFHRQCRHVFPPVSLRSRAAWPRLARALLRRRCRWRPKLEIVRVECGSFSQVVYLLLIRTYSSVKSQVHT